MITLCLCAVLSIQAQTGDNSPYSRFGIGDLADDNLHHLKQMSGLGSSYADAFHINIMNPASYSHLRTTSFDLGVYANRGVIKSDDVTAKQWTGNLEYISLAFPLYNPLNQLLDREERKFSLGMAFTIKPHSTVSYDISSQSEIDSIGSIVRSYNGTGGSYKFLWGNSMKYKNLSLGLNLGYLFGNIDYNRNIDFVDLNNARVNRFTNEYTLKGFLYDFGLLYTHVLNKKDLESDQAVQAKNLNIGLTLNSATGFSTNSDITYIGEFIVGNSVNIDTASTSQRGIEGDGRLPGTIGLGVNYQQGDKFALGIDYRRSGWSKYYNEANKEAENVFNDTQSFAIGGYFRPNYKSFTNYWHRVYYRFGVYHKEDPRVIQGTQMKKQGVTMGLGLPFVFQRKVSHVNLGVDIGRRGWDTPISENYVRFTLGFTFNDDEWFVKRKYN